MKQETRNPGSDLDHLIERVIGAGITVHRELGPGYVEAPYENSMAIELRHLGIPFERQKPFPIRYRGEVVGEHRLDLLVMGTLVVELKAITGFEPVHYAILRSYLKATGCETGLLMNFAAPTLQIKRVGPEFTSGARR